MGEEKLIDFSEHSHRVEIFKNGDKEIRIDHLQKNDSRMEYIQFINTDEIMSVTGDYGNWIFCRPFIPSAEGKVSVGYWIEKLETYNELKLDKLDLDSIEVEIQELIDTGLEDYGYEGDKLEEAKEWFQELLEETSDELDYLHKAYRDYRKPNFIDYDMIPRTNEIPKRLLIIFEAFDEICNRLKK